MIEQTSLVYVYEFLNSDSITGSYLESSLQWQD